MNIIALKGRHDSGKSTTIRLLHGFLIQQGYQVISTTFHPDCVDFRTVFSYNGKLIGITSSGDNYDLVHDNLDALINAGCTICVCACRTYDRDGNGTHAAISSFSGFQHEFVDKNIATTVAQQQTANNSDVQVLFNRIDNYA